MIGTILGIGLAISYVTAAFSPTPDSENFFGGSLLAGLGIIALWTIIGVVLFPRTVGIAFTPPIFVTPIAFIGGWIKNGFNHGISMLVLGLAIWASSQLIAKMRPSAT